MNINIHKHPSNDVARLWALRALVKLGGYKGLPGYPGDITPGDDVLRLVGLGYLNYDQVNRRGFVGQLRDAHADEELLEPGIEGNLLRNLDKLGDLLGLNQVEQQVLGLALVLHSHEALEETTDALGNLNSTNLAVAVAALLKIRRPLIAQALGANGMLGRSGLLRVSRGYPATLKNKVEPLEGLVDRMFEPHQEAEQLVDQYFHRASPGTLYPSDYPHILRQYRLLNRYLRKAVNHGLKGVNILLYGPAGTGKSELARTIATDCGLELYEVSFVDIDGDPVHRSIRVRSYGLSQYTLARHGRALVLFDEIEDVFDDDYVGVLNKSAYQKVWFNRLLEENPVPAIWITNDVNSLDPAHIRRFDVVVELGVPPRRVRRKIMQKHLGKLSVSDGWINSLSENEDLAPAVVARSAKVAQVVGGNQNETEQNLQVLLRETLGAMGMNNRIATAKEPLIPYSLEFLNADVDLHELVEGLRRHRSARICLYGVSGSGKSAFVRHLAHKLDMPLLVRRASDLLGPYVGETEQALAQMFRSAADDGAMLLLDEADSFFRERQGADHRWEATQVNELLTQMEDFEGIFVCSTNLMETFDQASLRRFDLKIKFDYLSPVQAWTLFQQVIRTQDQGLLDAGWHAQLARLSSLTPGDFAVVVRRNRLAAGPLTPQRLLEELAREASLKDRSHSKAIGFTAKI